MPNYDYGCDGCEARSEVFHSMSESPEVVCDCGRLMKKLMSACGFSVRSTSVNQRRAAKTERETDIRQDLAENYGVEKVHSAVGQTLVDVHRDVKMQGSFVKDRMDYETERREAKRRVESKEWMKKAMKRAPERSRMKDEQKAKEAQKKRRIMAR